MKHTRMAAFVGALSAALLVLGTTSASAGPPEIDHFTNTDSHIEQVAHAEDNWCEDEDGNDLLGFLVLWTVHEDGTFVGVERNGVFYGGVTIRVEQTWMNVDNEKTLTAVWQGTDRDHLVVPQEDGTLMLTILHTGVTKYYGPEGERLFTDVGREFFTIHVDADYNFIEFLGGDMKGHFETIDRDFCADILEFLG